MSEAATATPPPAEVSDAQASNATAKKEGNGGPFGKLFVGQVPAVCTEEMLTPLFQPYGTLLEIKIMRDSQGRSKGCAWVRYETQAQAQAAIEALHEKHTIPPQTNMLQVRYAQSRNSAAAGVPGVGGVDAKGEKRAQSNGAGSAGPAAGRRNDFKNQRNNGGNGPFNPMMMNGGGHFPPFGGQYNPAAAAAAAAAFGAYGMGPGFGAGMMYPNPMMGMGWPNPLLQGHFGPWGGLGGPAGGFDQFAWPQGGGGHGGHGGSNGAHNGGARLKRSPPGSSCFVGNLPPTVSPNDLRNIFLSQMPNANITQTSIHRDKRFGFITFATPEEAAQASQKLTGYLVGENKIRVEVTQNEPKNSAAAAAAGKN